MTDGQKSKIEINLKRAIKAAENWNRETRKLNETCIEVFGRPLNENDSIVDSLHYGHKMTAKEFIKHMKNEL